MESDYTKVLMVSLFSRVKNKFCQ